MIDVSKIDCSGFDQPELLSVLFHPRAESALSAPPENMRDFLIPVADNQVIGAKLHHKTPNAPTILFFHGNGEIVADYDDLGPLLTATGVNFLPVDYRGYGRSSGFPTVTAMMRDCHLIFGYVRQWLKKNAYTGPLLVMGRSLGSASALELAAHYADRIDGLIIESGFAHALPLLERLGADIRASGIREENGFRNLDKIRKFERPTRIIHAEFDHIIPFNDGQALFDACPAADKKLVKIARADHNTIFACGMQEYLNTIGEMVNRVS